MVWKKNTKQKNKNVENQYQIIKKCVWVNVCMVSFESSSGSTEKSPSQNCRHGDSCFAWDNLNLMRHSDAFAAAISRLRQRLVLSSDANVSLSTRLLNWWELTDRGVYSDARNDVAEVRPQRRGEFKRLADFMQKESQDKLLPEEITSQLPHAIMAALWVKPWINKHLRWQCLRTKAKNQQISKISKAYGFILFAVNTADNRSFYFLSVPFPTTFQAANRVYLQVFVWFLENWR